MNKYTFKGVGAKDIIRSLTSNKVDIPKDSFYVYMLFQDDKIVYVGQTTNLYSRVARHTRDKEFDSYSFVEVPNEEYSNELEAFLIMILKPQYNKEIPYAGAVALSTFKKMLKDRNPKGVRKSGYFKGNIVKDLERLGVYVIRARGTLYIPKGIAERIVELCSEDVLGEGIYETCKGVKGLCGGELV